MRSVELFAGAGGLGLGFALAGFKPEVVIEWDRWACDTIRENQSRGFPLVRDWNVFEGDVRSFDYSNIDSGVDLVSGGPPCQPFSLGGKHRAFRDKRDMFSAAVDVMRALRPRAFVLENVKGITRTSFLNYFQYIMLQLSYPELRKKGSESWMEHHERLEKHKVSGRIRGLTYNVIARVLNAANYGIPQVRERVFLVGFRSDLGTEWAFPTETHSLDSLLRDKWISGEYWERHRVSARNRPQMPSRLRGRIAKIREADIEPGDAPRPWETVRDAVFDLPDPVTSISKCEAFFNHRFQPGARSYPGHTGSPLDEPAKTLKAGDHGVPGGENMLRRPDGSVRYFTVRESARLQTFPDDYLFHGSWTETMRQLGNAVPVKLSRIVANSIRTQLA